MSPLGKFCHACQAIPIHGYCNIAGCPTGRLRDREFFAIDNLVMAASEGGANDIATAQDEEIANTIADALTKAHAPRGDLDVILEWYGGLSVGARQKLSLADLHGLSKRLAALPTSADPQSGEAVPSRTAQEPPSPTPCDLDWSEFEDEISDAISDSIDMDWSARDGAKAVVALLNKVTPQ